MKAIGVGMLLLTSVALADSVVVELPVAELKLKNGKVLRDAVIKTFDPGEETATVLTGKTLMTTPLAWLPEGVVTQLRELTPPPKSAAQVEAREKAAKERARKEEARAAREAQRTEQTVRKANKTAAKESAATANAETAVATAAATRARNYFRYEYNKGSGLKFKPELEMEAPEPVPGWARRYRVSGKAYVQSYADQGSFDSTSRAFDVLVEIDAKGRAKVVDLTLK